MAQIRFRFVKSSLALSLKLALIAVFFALAQTQQGLLAKGIPQTWQAREYQPPTNIGAPRRVGGAGTRGSGCPVDGKPLTALVPSSQFGVTVADYPTFFVYMPPLSPQASPLPVEFRLEDANGTLLYRTTFQSSGKSGILALTLSPQAGLSPLKVDQDYTWSFSMICTAGDRSRDVAVEGLMRRVELNPTLKAQVMQASPVRQVELYAEAEIWHDALATLAQLRRNNPSDLVVAQQWQKLLSAADLSNLTQEGLISTETTPQSQFTSFQD
jgi:hypothetical protein